MSVLNIGVLGCANIAQKAVIPAIKSIEELQLSAVASRSKDKAEKLASKFNCRAYADYSRLIDDEDIRIIYIPLPTGLHEEWIMRAIEAGKHVFVEKSMAMNYESASRIISEAKKHNLLIMENYMFQYHSQHEFVRQLIENGDIGRVNFIKGSFGFPPLPADNFRYNAELGGGVLLDAGGYPLKAAQMFLEKDLDVIGASLIYDDILGVDIYGGAILSNSAGQIAQLSFSFSNFYQCNYEIWGENGKITVDRAYTPPPNFSPKVTLERKNYRQEYNLPPDNHFIKILKFFHQATSTNDYQKHWNEILRQALLQHKIRGLNAR